MREGTRVARLCRHSPRNGSCRAGRWAPDRVHSRRYGRGRTRGGPPGEPAQDKVHGQRRGGFVVDTHGEELSDHELRSLRRAGLRPVPSRPLPTTRPWRSAPVARPDSSPTKPEGPRRRSRTLPRGPGGGSGCRPQKASGSRITRDPTGEIYALGKKTDSGVAMIHAYLPFMRARRVTMSPLSLPRSGQRTPSPLELLQISL